MTKLFKITICLCFLMVWNPGMISNAAQEEGLSFYVSTEGNEAWSGKMEEPNDGQSDGPFATLEQARDAIRKLKADGPLEQPIHVYIRGGRYEVQNPIIFSPQDSGTENSTITYSAYPNEHPIFSGGEKIQDWKPGEGDLWTASIPEVREGKWEFNQLFVNGNRRTRARTPNDGFFHIDGPSSQDHPFQLKYENEDIKPEWAKRGDVEVIALLAWAELRMPIASVDQENKIATLAGNPRPSNKERNARYYVENSPDLLDTPGEWYLNEKTGALSYWPMEGEDMNTAEVIAPNVQQLVLFKGNPAEEEFVRHLHINGLTFSHTAWVLPENGYADIQAAFDIPAAVSGNGVESCRIEKCVFQHLGNYALEFTRGCKNNRIVGNIMTDLGAGGIKIGEPAIRKGDSDLTTDNRITDNHIYNIGIVYPAAIGVWIGQSSGNTVAHNEINDTYYSGISVGWTWGYRNTNAHHNVIEYNHVHHIGRRMLSDMGGIYTLGVQPGTVICNNLFHDISSYGYGGWGIYPDEGSSHILIENNIVYNTKSAGFHQHYGKENRVQNNIFAFGKENQIMRTRMEDHISFFFENNIVYWKQGKLLGSNWKDDKYRFDSNVYWKVGGEEFKFAQWTWKEWQERGQDVHSKIADPLFVDPSNHDFRLKDNSPVLDLGFNPISMKSVGPRKEKIRLEK